MIKHEKRPDWLKVRAPTSKSYHNIKDMLKGLNLVTVCQEAICPNIEECWTGGTATFMLMGDTCTRACRFCAVKTGNPKGILDEDEPFKVGHAISKMALDYVVLTSVDRDDLEDLGADHFAKTIEAIKENKPKMIVEVLTPDFNAVPELIERILEAKPDVFAHNIETTEALTPSVRDRRSQYRKSLKTLALAKEINPKQYTKTSIMLGLGEKDEDVMQALKDLREVGCDVVTFGQYLAPTNRHKKYLPIVSYETPEKFAYWKTVADDMGFLYCASGPLVRSSYKAGEFFMKGVIEKERAELEARPTFPTL
jgi:lipoic acid synthetase